MKVVAIFKNKVVFFFFRFLNGSLGLPCAAVERQRDAAVGSRGKGEGCSPGRLHAYAGTGPTTTCQHPCSSKPPWTKRRFLYQPGCAHLGNIGSPVPALRCLPMGTRVCNARGARLLLFERAVLADMPTRDQAWHIFKQQSISAFKRTALEA